MTHTLPACLAALTLAACAAAPSGMAVEEPSAAHVPPGEQPHARARSSGGATRIHDRAMAEELRGNSGLTLQWISWDWRGQVDVRQEGDTLYLSGEQDAAAAPDGVRDLAAGSVTVSGRVAEVGADYFVLDGRVVIDNAPDPGRHCVREGPMIFRITQNRKYWRLQDMEGCGDGLTDYVDIYY